MDKYLLQIRSNKELYLHLTTTFPDQYFDWKITLLFYTSLHLFNAFCEKNGLIPIPKSHDERNKFFNPSINRPGTKIKKEHFDTYFSLYQRCLSVRYDGITNIDKHNIKYKEIHDGLKPDYEKLERYICGNIGKTI